MNDGHGTEQVSADEVREARFPQARRGYEREAVHSFLDRIADWVDTVGSRTEEAGSQVTNEFARVGERTAGILTAAEEAASKLRSDAKEYAEKLRTSAEAEARRAKLNASQKADELIAEAESKAEGIVEEAIVRRRRLNQAVSNLIERREEIAEEAQTLADQLLEAVDSMRSDEPTDEGDEPEDAPEDHQFRPGNAPSLNEQTELEPPDQRETTIHDPRYTR